MEFFWEVFEEGALPFLCGANCHMPFSNTQIVDLERFLIVKVLS